MSSSVDTLITDLDRSAAMTAVPRCVTRVGTLRNAARLLPEPERDRQGIDVDLLPPGGFVAVAVHFAVVSTAYGHCELVAHLAAERSLLREPEVMRFRRQASANDARLSGDQAEVKLIAIPTWLRQSKDAFVDPFDRRSAGALCAGFTACMGLRASG
jgi:hypothetical protein